jgi:hypothetical protein
VDNIKMDIREIGWDGVDWFDMAQNRVLNLRVPYKVGKFLGAAQLAAPQEGFSSVSKQLYRT